MLEIEVDISELKSEGSDLIKKLAKFLEEKTGVEIETTTDKLVIKNERETVSKTHLRMLLRKFLHKQELKDYFRVISGKENILTLKERKIAKE